LKILIIQTAFPGDVILATALAEKIAQSSGNHSIDYLIRDGNQGILKNNPHISQIFTLGRGWKKISGFLPLIFRIRKEKYDWVVNVHRFGSSGLITWFSGAKTKSGFSKNPFSFCYDHALPHHITKGTHETERNQSLIRFFTDEKAALPKIFFSEEDRKKAEELKPEMPYIVMAPGSVWETKKLPFEKWVQLISLGLDKKYRVVLTGGSGDRALCQKLMDNFKGAPVHNLAGLLSFPQSGLLMRDAAFNFVNDSAPLHLGIASGGKVSAFFCSTVPEFGFGPPPGAGRVIETKEALSCRPCGLHGKRACPEGHFKCGHGILISEKLFDE
jgi:ADP-heptose:LPS heptosyltransferase